MTSDQIKDIMEFFDFAKKELDIAQHDLDVANTDLGDLEHFVEFQRPNAATMSKIYKLLRCTRRRRRDAKDRIELYSPIVEWGNRNKGAVKELQGLLGTIRKIERAQSTRAYSIRGHILDDITDLSHLCD